MWAAILSVVLGLAVNECCDVAPWAAKRLARWSARMCYDKPERAEIRAEELVALIDARPGKLLKLITALCFAAAALRAWVRRATAGLYPSTPVISSGGAVILKKAAVASLAGAVAFAGILEAEVAVTRGLAAPPAIHQPPRSAAGTSAPRAAGAIAALLAQHATDRPAVVNAVGDAADCGPNLEQDAEVFRNAAAGRREAINELESINVGSALPGPTIRDLSRAWQASAIADGDLAQFAEDEAARGCAPNDISDPGYQAASVPDHDALVYKRAFVTSWNAIAAKYHLAKYQWDQV